jgi:hypothetical protein
MQTAAALWHRPHTPLARPWRAAVNGRQQLIRPSAETDVSPDGDFTADGADEGGDVGTELLEFLVLVGDRLPADGGQ